MKRQKREPLENLTRAAQDGSISFNPKVLSWARLRSGFPIERVAWALEEQPETIKSWETGGSVPPDVHLEALADRVFKLPMAIFFLLEVPDESDPEAFESLLEDLERIRPPGISLDNALTVWLMGSFAPLWGASKEAPEIRNLKELSVMLEERMEEWVQDWKREGFEEALAIVRGFLLRQLEERFGLLAEGDRLRLEATGSLEELLSLLVRIPQLGSVEALQLGDFSVRSES